MREGESAIWIWAPIITSKCPGCGNSPSYHETSGCEYDETKPDEWDEGLVGFRPTPVFDVSQTEGEPLPKLETAAVGDGEGLVGALKSVAGELGAQVEIIPEHGWTRGGANGVCRYRQDGCPEIEVVDRENDADVARTLIHEYAHALLHDGGVGEPERAKREVEAESTAYVVGRACGLDMDGSAFYVAAWTDDEVETIRDRVDRISRTATEIIDVLEN